MVKIVLKSGKDEALRRFHPWVFSGAVKKIYGHPTEGDIVEVCDNKDEFLGWGHYQNGSIIVRIISFDKCDPDFYFWKSMFQKALDYRINTGIAHNNDFNVYRLIHAEADGLPGLIVDYYNGHLVLQAHSIGMHKLLPVFKDVLVELYQEKLMSVYDKSNETLPKMYPVENGFLHGTSAACTVDEYGHAFNIDFVEGQKTGFFVDQRENRKLLKQFVKDKKVLNTFCYSGGFSIYALNGGASLVHSVDSSRKAIDTLEKNIILNNMQEAAHTSFVSDTLDFLKSNDNTYDVIILDPPAYAKHKDVKHNAVQGYKRLNYEAIQKLNKGGILFTFSCSQVVDNYLFKSTVIAAAIKAGRKSKILYQLHQAADHPVNPFHPESEYLKGLVLYFE